MKPNEKRDCKIVRDLLPNYIEKLTDEVTNEFIEEHISKCEECRRALHDMNGEVEVEEFNQDEEIKYLKRLNTKVKMTIAIVTLIVIIIASCVSIYIYNKNKIQINNYTFIRAEYIVENRKDINEGKLYGTLIAVMDEKGKCKSVRVVEEGYNEEELNAQIDIIREMRDFSSNAKIVNNQLHYNTNIWNGINKEEMEKRWKEYYIIQKIEEI